MKLLIVAASLAFIGGKAHSRFRVYLDPEDLKHPKEGEPELAPADVLPYGPLVEFDSVEILAGKPTRSVTFTIDTLYAKDLADAHGFELDEEHLAAIKAAQERYLEAHPELLVPPVTAPSAPATPDAVATK